MTVQKLLIYPKHRAELRRKSNPISELRQKERRLITDLKDTLQASPDGIGLAAPQIGAHQRVVIVCVGNTTDGGWQAGPPIALVNPVIVESSEEHKDFDGCLSFPGLYGETIRPHHLRVTGMDEEGQFIDRVFDGFNAVVVHHEIDHLDGVLFIDRIKNREDLFTIRENEQGELVKEPITNEFDLAYLQAEKRHKRDS